MKNRNQSLQKKTWSVPYFYYFSQITLSHQTDNYVRSPGYNGYVPSDSSYYSLNTTGLTVGQFSVSSYSSDATEINYSAIGSPSFAIDGLRISVHLILLKAANDTEWRVAA